MALTLDAETGVVLPSWTTGNRPAAPTEGTMGYNTTLNQVEFWNGTDWIKAL
jgi:hypothetical protein